MLVKASRRYLMDMGWTGRDIGGFIIACKKTGIVIRHISKAMETGGLHILDSPWVVSCQYTGSNIIM